MVDDLGRDPNRMCRALTDHLIAAFDAEDFPFHAQPRHEAAATGADEEIVIGDSTLQPFEFRRLRPDVQRAKTLQVDEIGLHGGCSINSHKDNMIPLGRCLHWSRS